MIVKTKIEFERRRDAQISAYYDELDVLNQAIKHTLDKIDVLEAMTYDEYLQECLYDRRKEALDEI